MKLKRYYNLINESIIDDRFKLSEKILSSLKLQNQIIENAEDIFIDILDIWGHDKIPVYDLVINTGSRTYEVELMTKSMWDYFEMCEGDYDDLKGDYKDSLKTLSEIRQGKINDIQLKIKYQYANSQNEWEYYKMDDEFNSTYSEVEKRLNMIGCKTNKEVKSSGALGNHVENSDLILSIDILVPVRFNISKTISPLDGISDQKISKYNDFVKDYNLDNEAQTKLSDLIRSK